MVSYKIHEQVEVISYCIVFIFYVSSMSPNDLPGDGVAVSDKALHMLEYGIMGILAWEHLVEEE